MQQLPRGAPCITTPQNFTYFGDIFTVAGSRGSNTVECGNPTCRADLTFDYNKRVIVVDKTPEEKAVEIAAAEAKTAAAAAKKVGRWGQVSPGKRNYNR